MRLSTYFDSLTGETIGAGNLERDEDGNLTITVDSSMLPGVNVDTYQCFTGDSWEESEIDWLVGSAEGMGSIVDHPAAGRAEVELDWDDFDWNYDHHAILWSLSEAAAEDLINAGGIHFDQIITGAEVNSVWSPAAYNFATDSFTVTLTLDTEALAEALGDVDAYEVEEWARERWASRDGFISNIPRYFDEDTPWATVWASVAKVLVEADYDGTMATAEAEWEAYASNTTTTLNHRGAEKIWEAVTGEEVPDDLDLHDAESLTEALHDRIPVQDEALPIPEPVEPEPAEQEEPRARPANPDREWLERAMETATTC